jgi:RNA polymerase sigma-70 factor, ECF subfamily
MDLAVRTAARKRPMAAEPPAKRAEVALPGTLDEAQEAALAERVKQGDTSAFETLVNQHMRRAFSVAYRLLGHREDAEDLVQDAFLTALEKIDSHESGRAFGPWFYRILVNRGLNARKSRALRQTEAIPDDTAAAAASPLHHAEQAEVRAKLHAALAELPERQRRIIELFELEGFSGHEIAEIMEIPAGTVRWHIHQARKALQQTLAPLARRLL